MKRVKNFFLLLTLGVVVMMSSCSKDDDKDNGSDPEVFRLVLEERLENIDVPEAMKTTSHPYASQAAGYVETIKGIASYFDFFVPDENAQILSLKSTAEEPVYFWSYGGYSIWMYQSETSDAYKWNVDWDFGSGRVKYISAEEKKDGSGGWMKIHNYTNPAAAEDDFLFQYVWGFDDDNNATLTMSDYTGGFNLEIKANTDLSGSAQYLYDQQLQYEYLWNPDGSGSYSYYVDGEVFMSESWTAGDL